MKPNSPGVWYASDARVAIHKSDSVAEYSPELFCTVHCPNNERLEGDWIKAEPPKFPELPALHYRVLAKASPTAKFQFTGTHWFYFEPKLGEFHGGKQGYWAPQELEVCDHPKNDPEAVKQIEEAQRAVCSR